MGQAHTVANGGGRRRRLSSLCHPFGAHSRNLSATFHATDSEVHWEQLNVNVATEEELMTLPRVTRHLARNIVDYRQAIGGFKKVEDLALVSGVGASLLQVGVWLGTRTSGAVAKGSEEGLTTSEDRCRIYFLSCRWVSCQTDIRWQFTLEPQLNTGTSILQGHFADATVLLSVDT